MTRKDYVLIAEAIKATRAKFDDVSLNSSIVVNDLTDTLIKALETTNDLFDAERFWKATFTVEQAN